MPHFINTLTSSVPDGKDAAESRMSSDEFGRAAFSRARSTWL